jgi:hypothetical protein
VTWAFLALAIAHGDLKPTPHVIDFYLPNGRLVGFVDENAECRMLYGDVFLFRLVPGEWCWRLYRDSRVTR